MILAGGLIAPVGRGGRPGDKGRIGTAKLSLGEGGPVPDESGSTRAVANVLCAATGLPSVNVAVQSLFRPNDVIGIKINGLGGPRMSPRLQLVTAFAELLTQAGIPPASIIVFERSSRELQRAGYPIRREGGPFLCYGIDNDYDREPSTSGSIGSCFARLVSSHCTALVSFGVVKDHDLAGVSAGLKNWYGVIHNPNKYHDHNCDPYVADVVNHPFIKTKLRLTVLDGVVAQYHGGPAFRADTTWPLGLVAASTDPVAIDAWAWLVIDAERRKNGLPTLDEAKRPPRFIATAESYGLGIGDIKRIKVVSP